MPDENSNDRNTSIRICVDTANNRRIGGRLYSRQISQPLLFTDLSGLLLQAEAVLDLQQFPVAFQRKRSFGASKPSSDPLPGGNEPPLGAEAIAQAYGAVSTFVIYVRTRQNATWQGELAWLNDTPRQPFSSDLELIRLVDEAIFGA